VAPGDLVRHDAKFKALGLDPDGYTTKAAVVDVLVEHGALMQRPVVEYGDTVILARPPTKFAEFLDTI
jgi:arsenate reductase (glutaredoxin)